MFSAWPLANSGQFTTNDCPTFSIKRDVFVYTTKTFPYRSIIHIHQLIKNCYAVVRCEWPFHMYVCDIVYWIINGIQTFSKISNFVLLTELCSDDDDDVDGKNEHHFNQNIKRSKTKTYCPSFALSLSTRHTVIIDFITSKQIITLETKSIEFIDKIRYAEREQEKANELHIF